MLNLLHMNPQSSALLWLAPLIIGAIIALINSDEVNEATEKAEAWLKRAQANAAASNSWFKNLILKPLLWLLVRFSDWTDGLEHRGLKNGLRIATAFYFVVLWGFILLYLIRAVVIIIAMGAILYFIYQMLLRSDSGFSEGVESVRRTFGPAPAGSRIHPETGIIQERGLVGWVDTDERIDPKTGRRQTRGLVGWVDTGSRVDLDTGTIQEDSFFGYIDTDTRINPETGVLQKNGAFGWQDTEERIDLKTGKHQKKGMLGWVDD